MATSLKKNTFLNIIRTCSAIFFPLITFPYISRVLLPDNVGKINFAQSYVNYFTLLAGLGISTYAMRECAIAKKDKKELSKVASQIFSINLITTIISYLILFASLIFYKEIANYRTLIVIESFVIAALTFGADWLNSALEDYKYITIRTIVFQILSLILMFIFVKSQDDYYKYAIISVLSTAGASITNIWYRKRYCDIHFTLDIDWKRHISPIILLFVMQLAVTIFNNADITMLGIMQNDYQVGIYSTALKVTRIIGQVVQSLSAVIIPRLTVYFENNDFTQANKLLRKVLGFNLSLGLPCVVGVIMLANEIIFLIGGSEYAEAVPVIRILILSFMFSLVGGSFLGNAVLIPMKKEKYYMIVCCITAIVNIILNALLIPQLAAIGATISTAFNGFLVMFLLMLKVDKRIRIERIKSLFVKPIIGCLLIVFCCLLCGNISNIYLRTVISVLLSVAAYVIIEVCLKNDILVSLINSFGRKILNRNIIKESE